MLVLRRAPRLDPRQQAFLYQVQAVEAVRGLEYAALFHEQGLGKTKIGVDLALTWLKEGVVDSVLIVTKRSLIENWRQEIQFHTHFEARVLGQDRRANFLAFNSPARLYLAHYEVLRSEQRRLLLFQRTRNIGVILDESQKIKNPTAGITTSLLALAPGFKRRVIMTGTPVANRPEDLWSQIKFLDGGRHLGESFRGFREHLDLSNDLASDKTAQEQFERKLGAVFGMIRAFTVRETKSTAGVDLPEKRVENVSAELEPVQRELYRRFREELGSEIIQDGRLVDDDAEGILKRLLRLVQVASNPALVDDRYSGVPGKFPVASNLVAKATGDGSKVIVWTSFVENAEWLRRRFDDCGAVAIHGRIPIAARNARLAEFKSNESCRVLVATPGSAKEGLTLTVANHAIFYDRSFSLDDYLQAQDRIHRISQTRECYIWNLVAIDTVDEWIDLLLAAKRLAAQLAQGDITVDAYHEHADYDFGLAVKRILGKGAE